MFRPTLARRQLLLTAVALSAGALLEGCAPGAGPTAGGGSSHPASGSAAAGGGGAITVAALLDVIPGLSLPPTAIRKAPPWFTDWMAAFNHRGAAGRATVVAAGPSTPDVNGVDSSVFESWVFGTPPRSPARALDLSGVARLANQSLPAVLPALAHAFTGYVRSPSASGAYAPLAGRYAAPLLWHNFCLLANVELLQGLGLSLPQRERSETRREALPAPHKHAGRAWGHGPGKSWPMVDAGISGREREWPALRGDLANA